MITGGMLLGWIEGSKDEYSCMLLLVSDLRPPLPIVKRSNPLPREYFPLPSPACIASWSLSPSRVRLL